MKNKKGLIVLSVIAIIILSVIILGALYFTTDLFKTEQQLFYKYLAQTKIMDTSVITKLEEINERISTNSNSSSANLKVSLSTLNQETGIADVQNILNVKSDGLENVISKQSYRDFVFSSNEQNFLTLKYIRDDNTYGIGADNILAKYLTVENANLKDLFSKLGVEDTTQIPDTITTESIEDIYQTDETTLNQLKETYGMLIYNNISKESFYKVTNEDKTETIGVALSEQEFSNIVKLLLETVKNDTTLLNLIISEAQKQGNNITIESMQLELQNYIDNIANETYATDKDFIKLSLTKKDKTVIKLQLESNFMEETISQDESFAEIEQKNNIKLEIDFSETNKIYISAKANDIEIAKLVISYSYDDSNINLGMEFEIKEIEGEIISFKVQYQMNNYQTDNISQNFAFDISNGSEMNFNVNLTNNIILKQDVQISKLTTENSAKLNDMTSEEIEQLFTALGNRINQLYGENLMGSGIIESAEEATEQYKQAVIEEQQGVNYYQNPSN